MEKKFKELENYPKEGNQNPEKLEYELCGYWSRKHNKKDRSTYKILDEEVIVIIVSALGHNTHLYS